jgi:hypothetical protein
MPSQIACRLGPKITALFALVLACAVCDAQTVLGPARHHLKGGPARLLQVADALIRSESGFGRAHWRLRVD